MQELFNQYKPTLLFIVKFFVFYALGSWLYGLYLNTYPDRLDPFSVWVTRQSSYLLGLIQNDIITRYYEGMTSAYVYCGNSPIYSIIEGCNAMSVMILFVAFLLAFKAPLKNYLWFIPSGLIILHVSNIIRIASIGKINANIPEWSQAAHDYLFPAWIYGTVILLWIVWVKYLSK